MEFVNPTSDHRVWSHFFVKGEGGGPGEGSGDTHVCDLALGKAKLHIPSVYLCLMTIQAPRL